jgi:tRNA (guanosine-2'-O-)-methyltransferase
MQTRKTGFFTFVAHIEKDTTLPFTALSPELQIKLLNHLKGFITPERWGKFEQIIQLRTRYITIVLEDIYQSHNASAVLRSCDCFGIQDVHIIENINKYEVNPDVALGAPKWLTLEKYNQGDHNTFHCLDHLKSNGYKIYCTTPHENNHTPETLPLDHKFAMVFGTELAGLSRTALEMADGFIKIPMVGFTESLNISVSAALLMNRLSSRLRGSEFIWTLTEPEKLTILLEWVANTIKRSELIIQDFLQRETKN